MAVPGDSDLIAKIFTQCNLLASAAALAVAWLAMQYAKLVAARETDRTEAAKRIDTANSTIVRLLEANNKADENVAIALARIETRLVTVQPRGGGDC